MKLVKSLLLGSAAGLAAVASAQAADLPFRKAAPVDYVRVCDWVSGGGYFYIPGTDTCLKLGGEVRAEYAFNETNNTFVEKPLLGATPTGGLAAGTTVATGLNNGTFTRARVLNESGYFVRTKLEADARTQTAYGLFRANLRLQLTWQSGDYNGTTGGTSINNGQVNTTIDRGYITFAGITAGRLQSFFDFYADNYNYEGIATSDETTNVFAYTATFGGGFSATISVEDPLSGRRNGINNIGIGAAGLAIGGAADPFGAFGSAGAAYAGTRIPDVVGQVRYDQAWGAVQLSGAYHDVDTFNTAIGGAGTPTRDETGYAFRGGVDVKLPMIAAGDELWLEGGYQRGAYLYQDSGASVNNGFYGVLTGGLVQGSPDAVAVPTTAGGNYNLALGSGFSVLAAFHHYFTPQFHDVLFGSYEEQGYGNTVRNTDWRLGGIGDESQYKIGNQFIFTPVHNLDIGLEVLYTKVNQDVAGMTKAQFRALVPGIATDPDAFRVTLHFNRDF